MFVANLQANRGIGREIVRQIALNHKSTVVLTARDMTHGESVAKELREELQKRNSQSEIVFHQLDVTDKESAVTLSKWVKEKYGGLDVLVNNAGYAIKGSEVSEKVARDTIGSIEELFT